MSSQSNNSGSNNSSSGVVSSAINNGSPGQNGANSNSNIKSNSKISIDHQATLDKGLKMKIKRTKPGSKTSEAKHEIVKATEQQNGGSGIVGNSSSTNHEDNNANLSNTLNCQNANSTNNIQGINTNNNSSSNSSNKKHMNNALSNHNSSNSSNNNGNLISNSNNPNIPQTNPTSTKRGNSNHRREKNKDKVLHSSRGAVEKSSTITNEKELVEKNICQCAGDLSNSVIPCSSSFCIRRSDNGKHSERILNSNSTTNLPVISGIFTSSMDNNSIATTTISNMLSSTATPSTATSTVGQTVFSNCGANTPGPPILNSSQDINIKLSANLASQLSPSTISSNPSNPNIGSNAGNQIPAALTHSNENASSAYPSNSNGAINSNSGQMSKLMAPGIISATVHHTISVPVTTHSSTMLLGASSNISPTKVNAAAKDVADECSLSPPAKRCKHVPSAELNEKREMVDICVGTSVGTITEPDCLGPCEPGTSVNLEGIVWHETEGGVLVVNVTWRGKTYVGTLLDCTRHDWAPPRFCDSPIEEFDSRTPKGRGKRGRSATVTPDLSNFTETRSSIYFSHTQVHSKLRNSSSKGGRATSRTSSIVSSSSNSISTTNSNGSSASGNGAVTPSTSPTAFLPTRAEKRKSKDEPPSPINGEQETANVNMVNASGIPISSVSVGTTTQPQSLLNPVTGLNVQINSKKCKTTSPCIISPVLLECPEQDCNKKYKHANGLRYHQSHAHGSGASMDEDSLQLPELEETESTPSPDLTTSKSTTAATMMTSDITSKVITTSATMTTSFTANSTTTLNNLIPSSVETNVFTSHNINDLTQTAINPPPSGLLTEAITSNPEESSCGANIPISSSSNKIPIQQKQPQPQSQPLGLTISNLNASEITAMDEAQQNTSQQSNPVKPAAGILHFGQSGENKSNNVNLIGLQTKPTINQPNCSAIPEQNNACAMPTSNLNKFSPRYISNPDAQPPMAMQMENISVNKSMSAFSFGKQRRNRKSPYTNEYDEGGGGVGGNNNVASRDDVQSPAYSDISDDSTPVTDAGDVGEKLQSSKSTDLLKKSQDVEIPGSGNNHASSQHPLSSLSGYNMYQFFQQQQFVVQSSNEHPQANKSVLPTSIVMSPNPVSTSQNSQQSHLQMNSAHHLQQPPPAQAQQQQQTQQQRMSPRLDYSNKNKDALDLITKNTSSQLSTQQQLHDLNKAQDMSIPLQALNNAGHSHGQSMSSNIISNMNNISTLGSGGPPPALTSKPISHFYPFNYIPPNYPYNIESNYGGMPVTSEANVKLTGGNVDTQSNNEPSMQNIHGGGVNAIKEERLRETPDNLKNSQQNINSSKAIKTEPVIKQESTKFEQTSNLSTANAQQVPQQPVPIHPKDVPAYASVYPRHPIGLGSQQLAREEELRRYYVLSDQHRRQSNAMQQNLAVSNQQISGMQSVSQKDETSSAQQPLSVIHQQQHQHQQQSQLKQKHNPPCMANTSMNKSNMGKDALKLKQEEEPKLKAEGQKPTMETQGPPPPPTSQYFLHPSYIASTPFGFDPNHPIYRNVLMSAAPYNTQSYHIPLPRFHTPEDLSRNTSTKALDALHHAASQYYTTHKIHELNERLSKSPNSAGSNNVPGSVKTSISSPNICTTQASNTPSNVLTHHSGASQPSGAGALNLPTHVMPANPIKQQDVVGHKVHATPNGPNNQNTAHNEVQKQQQSNNAANAGISGGNGNGSNSTNLNATDSRSPPPQRHVHTHHHTHVGLGYPMYPAPYGAAVLASQQAAAVAVINPFPPPPAK